MNSRSAKPSCRHCGAPLLDARAVNSGFCCAGCSYVHRLISESGLDSYYQLKDSVTAPADPAVFQPRDYSWLDQLQDIEEKTASGDGTQPARIPALTLTIQGISCAGCVWLIERLYLQASGAREIIVNAQTGDMRVTWELGKIRLSDFAQKLQSFGYLVGPPGTTENELESRQLARRIGLCAAFAMNVMLFTLPTYFGMEQSFQYARLFDTISLGFATLSLLVGGSFFLNRALLAIKEGALHIDLPIALGIIGSYLGSLYGWLSRAGDFLYFDFVSTFILLMLVGRWAQVAAVERNRRHLLRQQIKPPSVRTETQEGTKIEIAPERLEVGNRFELLPGQTLPVEATLECDQRSFSLASINGESDPRIFRAGELVPAGALNISRDIAKMTARQTWADSLLSKLLSGEDRPGWRHRFMERVIRGYLIGIFIVAIASGVAWWCVTRNALTTGSVVTAILVVSCPCAIGLSFPLADEIAAVALRRRGVFIRENDLWAKLKRVRRIIFDKTGTLTLETPELLNPEVLDSLGERSLRALQALVRNSAHPVSQAILAEMLSRRSLEPLSGEVREEVGLGVVLRTSEGERWTLGRPAWVSNQTRLDVGQEPSGDVCLALNGSLEAAFHFADRVRADARSEVGRLARLGFEINILSGDRPAKVQAIAAELELPVTSALGGLSPSDKRAWLEANTEEDTMMLGDGANDSLAFDRALCRGTPVIHRGILEHKADFFYLGRGIGGIRILFAVDRVRRRTQWVILVVSVVYNALAVGLAVAGKMNPLIAAVLMPLNSLLSLAIATGMMRKAFTLASGQET